MYFSSIFRMNLVARLCTFSIKARSLAVCGDHRLQQYSSRGRLNQGTVEDFPCLGVVHISAHCLNEAKDLVGL